MADQDIHTTKGDTLWSYEVVDKPETPVGLGIDFDHGRVDAYVTIAEAREFAEALVEASQRAEFRLQRQRERAAHGSTT